jgi:dinuclear metal center YbgI/SA1388 family protein
MAPTLRDVLAELERLAPLHLAESWDNVGLLLEPRSLDTACARVLLTIDLTRAVLEEARTFGADLVVAYHPVLFGGVKRLRRSVPAEELLLSALSAEITVYSPHTALDAVAGGMTDWLAAALGPGVRHVIVPASSAGDLEVATSGQGRRVTLAQPLSLERAVANIKTHLGLSQLRLAAAARHQSGEEVRTLAVCPGAGGSVFERVGDVDLLLTGEMRHHDVLARVARGTSVVLCDHSNSERGYLPVWAADVAARLAGVEVRVAQTDRDPLEIL